MTLTATPTQVTPPASTVSFAGSVQMKDRWSGRGWLHSDAVFLTACVLVSLAIRLPTLGVNYWGDESIAIGISSHPVTQIPQLLRFDGSPPLYYVLLHYWMQMFGTSEAATHSLSLLAATACIPTGWWASRRLFSTTASKAAAALIATCPYLDYYGTETRMYALVALIAMIAVTCFVIAYREGGRKYWAASWVATVATVYLHNWSLYLVAAIVTVGVAVAWVRKDRTKAVQSLGFGVAALLAWLPWVPSFIFQAQNTGAPWSPHPTVVDLFADSFNAVSSAAWIAMVIGIGIGVVALTRKRKVADSNTAGGPIVHLSWGEELTGTALGMATLVPVATLLLGWLGAQIERSWSPRYLGVAIIPGLIGLGGALSKTRAGRKATVGIVLAMAATAVPVWVASRTTVDTSKSNVANAVHALRRYLHPGDLIISSQVTQLPVLAHYLGPEYRYATPLGLVKSPTMVDWSDLEQRLSTSNATARLTPLLDQVPAGGHVLVVNPLSWSAEETPSNYSGSVAAEGIAANEALLADGSFVSERTVGVPAASNPLYPVVAILFHKVR